MTDIVDKLRAQHNSIMGEAGDEIERLRETNAIGQMRLADAFDKDETAIQFLREDGDGGFVSGIGRMAREIERLNGLLEVRDAFIVEHDLWEPFLRELADG